MSDRSKQKLDEWLSLQKEQREYCFMLKRGLPPSPTTTMSANVGGKLIGDFSDLASLVKHLTKPKTSECTLALKQLKIYLVKNPEVGPTTFLKVPNALEHLVGAFTNQQALPNVALLAGECLVQLSLSTKVAVCSRLVKTVGSYVWQFLRCSNRKLVLISVWIIGNLASESIKTVHNALLAQGSLMYLVDLTADFNDLNIRTSALFSLLSCFNNKARKPDMADEFLSTNQTFPKMLVSSLREFRAIDAEEFELQRSSSWMLFILCFSEHFHLNLEHLITLAARLHSAIFGSPVLQLSIIFPVLRVFGVLFGKPIALPVASEDKSVLVQMLIRCCIAFLRSEHLALRKETIWLLCNLISAEDGSSCCDHCIIKDVVKVAEMSLSEEMIKLVCIFLFNCVKCSALSKEECKSLLATLDSLWMVAANIESSALKELLDM